MRSHRLATILLTSTLVLSACGDDTPDPAMDGGVSGSDSSVPLDSGVAGQDGSVDTDTGTTGNDAAPPTDGSTPNDAGTTFTPSFMAGVHLTVEEGRVEIGQTFSTVVLNFGAPTRRTAGMGIRSYEWDLSGGTNLVVWFANSNLDNDDDAPNDVDPTDAVLWVAVNGTYSGMDSSGITLGATQAAVTGAYGAADRSVPLTDAGGNPDGTLDRYFLTGIMFAYEQGTNVVRTITVTKAYPRVPDGVINVDSPQLTFASGGSIVTGAFTGSDEGDVTTLLGPPDGRNDNVTVGAATVTLLSYTFLGFEFWISPQLGDAVLFISVHAPFFGTTGAPGNVSMGDAKSAFETHVTSLGFAGPTASSINAQLLCYTRGGSDAVGATFSAAPETLTSVVLDLPINACP